MVDFLQFNNNNSEVFFRIEFRNFQFYNTKILILSYNDSSINRYNSKIKDFRDMTTLKYENSIELSYLKGLSL